jgi:hypothetical protein
MALNIVKKTKLGEKAQHDMEMFKKAQREKHQDRFSMIQTYKNQREKEHTTEAIEKFHEDCQ